VKFVDSCQIDVTAGQGGNGAIAFRREKFVPFGGPSGGDGGRGGDVILVASEGLSTLLDLAHVRNVRAKPGEHGQGKDCYGKAGVDTVIKVPVGTQVFDRETDELLFDIAEPQAHVVIAHGGKGGRGNIHFATPYDRAPRRAEPGEPGQERKLRLELKVMADVGLLGFPNVGKSTFVSAVSRARPKVADYPFTTLTPHLGMVRIGDEASFVVADIPGLIPGASEGHGLGHRFLKHVERCRALLHLVTLDPGEDREPLADYDALRKELVAFDPELAKRPEIVAMAKADLPEVREAYPGVRARFAKKKIPVRLVSAATGEGIRELLVDLYKLVTGKVSLDDWDSPREVAPPPASEKRLAPKKKPAVAPKKKTAATPKKKTAAAPKKKPAATPKKKPAATPKKKKTAATPKKKRTATAPKKKPTAAKARTKKKAAPRRR
jgi:GTPase